MLSVKIKNTIFKNPILTASGTFGYGNEIGKFIDIIYFAPIGVTNKYILY